MARARTIQSLEYGQAIFRIHGPKGGASLLADVFAQKLGTLVRALKAADRAVHRRSVHQYAIEKLKSSTPTVILSEQALPRFADELDVRISGIGGLEDCASAVITGDYDRALRYGNCALYLEKLGRGASKQFGYAEIWTNANNVIRVDPFLRERASAALAPQKEGSEKVDKPTQDWFKGSAHGSFDGTILAVDLRGSLPEVTLVLSAGPAEIDCIAREDHVEKIRAALRKRVRVYGDAIYDGRGGLPRRIHITDIEPVKSGIDFSRWQGSFEPFDYHQWDAEDE